MPVPEGAAEGISRFYSVVLGCPTRLLKDSAGLGCCEVIFVGDQTLRYQEKRYSAPPIDARDHDEAAAFHVCIYLTSASAFAEAFDRAQTAALLYVNPRFEGGPPEFASAATWDEALACGQFRVKDLIDTTTREVALVLEHEVRSPAHRCCPRAG